MSKLTLEKILFSFFFLLFCFCKLENLFKDACISGIFVVEYNIGFYFLLLEFIYISIQPFFENLF